MTAKPALDTSDVFDEARLRKLAQDHRQAFVANQPFHHVVLDDFMDAHVLGEAVAAFPSPDKKAMYVYDNPFEKKLAFDQVGRLPGPVQRVLRAMNEPLFLRFLEELTGIEGLIPDPYYRGGGIHQIEPGGKLDVHLDFNLHPKLKLERRLNAILYLNQNWREEFGGHLELWHGHRQGEKHVIERLAKKVLPVFNRLVVFDTGEGAYHGHPEPLKCPPGMTRKSMATYYYTPMRPEAEQAHSTMFLKRPGDATDAELERLREQRNRGRLSSNVPTHETEGGH